MRIYRPHHMSCSGSPETGSEGRQPRDQWVTGKTQPFFPQTSHSSSAPAPRKDLEYSKALQGRDFFVSCSLGMVRGTDEGG